jgi:hypothetical protein
MLWLVRDGGSYVIEGHHCMNQLLLFSRLPIIVDRMSMVNANFKKLRFSL